MADGWSGFEDGDMKLNFAGATFKVHRAVFAQASPVWNAMLTGSFAESNGDTIEFDGDDPEVARLCIELMYSTRADSGLDWTSIESRVASDRVGFDAFVDKYDLRGVKQLVAHELGAGEEKAQLKDENQRGVREVQRLKAEVENLKRKLRPLATKKGKAVSIRTYLPEIGTHVKRNKNIRRAENYFSERQGKIIAFDTGDDGATRVGVRWIDGEESHNLECGGANSHGSALEYA